MNKHCLLVCIFFLLLMVINLQAQVGGIQTESTPLYSGDTPTVIIETWVWVALVPSSRHLSLSDPAFTLNVQLGATYETVASYGFEILYDPGLLEVDTTQGIAGVSAGPDGYVNAAALQSEGRLVIAGFDVNGVTGGILNFLNIAMRAKAAGSTEIKIVVNGMTNATYTEVGWNGANVSVNISDVILGDVNGSTTVDIIDALMTAQYSIGLAPAGFQTAAADVNKSGSIDIIDALMIAQYCVGLINQFPGEILGREVMINGCTVSFSNAYLWRDFMPIVVNPGPDGGSKLMASIQLEFNNPAQIAQIFTISATVIDNSSVTHNLGNISFSIAAGETQNFQYTFRNGPYLRINSEVVVNLRLTAQDGKSGKIRIVTTINQTV